MTAETARARPERPPGPAEPGRGGGLSRCVAGDVEDFAERVWGRRPLLSPRHALPRDFSDLLDAEAVDELLSARGLRAPFVRVARDGTTFDDRTFTAGGGVGAGIADQVSDDKLLRLFAGGATVVLQGLHRTWQPLTAFSQQLAGELGHPVQVNAYVTPPQSQGFCDHYDVHDVFVLQVQGRKRWLVRSPVHAAPLRDQPWTDRRADVRAAAAGQPELDVVLGPGDCLYLPRGWLHAATTLGEVSTHVTVGVHTWTRHDLVEALASVAVERLAQDPRVRRSLPLGVDVGDRGHVGADVNDLRDQLIGVLRDLPVDAVTEPLSRRAADAERAAPIGPLAQLGAAADLDDDTTVGLRPHVRARLREHPDGGVLVSRAGAVQLTPGEVDAVAPLLAGGPVRVRDLPGHDAPALVRRLLLAGVIVVREA